MAEPRPRPLYQPFFYIRGEGDGYTADQSEALELVEIHRFIECDSYDKCLDTASEKMWPGFSCDSCPRRNTQ